MMETAPIPAAPAELPLGERLAWRTGYRQALDDLLQIELAGGEVRLNGEVIHKADPLSDMLGAEDFAPNPFDPE